MSVTTLPTAESAKQQGSLDRQLTDLQSQNRLLVGQVDSLQADVAAHIARADQLQDACHAAEKSAAAAAARERVTRMEA